jgi:antitoxin component YwqK of YwqJK toxin-antitoxin module
MKQNEEVKIEYWDNGNKRTESQYKNGELNGLTKMYHPDGSLSVESYYKNGKLDGVFTRWFDSGVMDIKKKYTNGKPDYNFKFIEGDDMELRELNLSK